jgi:hypothetical protein
MLFVPSLFEFRGQDEEAPTPAALRAQWLADGRRILVTWAAPEDTLNVALLPWGARGPFKLFALQKMEHDRPGLLFPVPVSGDYAFLARSDADELVRLDLSTGAIARHKLNSSITLLPTAADNGVFYFQEGSDPTKLSTFGVLDPETFTLTPAITFTNEMAKDSFLAYDAEGRRIAFVEKVPADALQVVVLAQGQPPRTRRLEGKEKELGFGSAAFSRSGDALLAACQKKTRGRDTVSYELMEISLAGGPIRETTLIPGVPGEDAAPVFQISLSHDGKTAAAVSTYLAGDSNKELKPEDCALFLVDLTDANRSVTKAPIPLPAKRSAVGK